MKILFPLDSVSTSAIVGIKRGVKEKILENLPLASANICRGNIKRDLKHCELMNAYRPTSLCLGICIPTGL